MRVLLELRCGISPACGRELGIVRESAAGPWFVPGPLDSAVSAEVANNDGDPNASNAMHDQGLIVGRPGGMIWMTCPKHETVIARCDELLDAAKVAGRPANPVVFLVERAGSAT